MTSKVNDALRELSVELLSNKREVYLMELFKKLKDDISEERQIRSIETNMILEVYKELLEFNIIIPNFEDMFFISFYDMNDNLIKDSLLLKKDIIAGIDKRLLEADPEHKPFTLISLNEVKAPSKLKDIIDDAWRVNYIFIRQLLDDAVNNPKKVLSIVRGVGIKKLPILIDFLKENL